MTSRLFFCGMRTDPRVLCTPRKHSPVILSLHTDWSLCILKVWMTSFSIWYHLRTQPNLTPWTVFCSSVMPLPVSEVDTEAHSPLSWLLWRYKVLSKVPFCLYRPTAPAWLLTWSFFLHGMALAPATSRFTALFPSPWQLSAILGAGTLQHDLTLGSWLLLILLFSHKELS